MSRRPAPEPELLYATTEPLSRIIAEEWTGTRVAAPGPLIISAKGAVL
jgi:hypothetical protein